MEARSKEPGLAQDDTFTLEGAGGQRIHVYRWLPTGPTKAVVQIAHGAAEHARRYRRVAAVLTAAGYAVYANDHRGHGRTAADFGRYGVAGPAGWDTIVSDARQLTEHIRSRHPGLPVVLFGHSMGGMIAQNYLQRFGSDLAGAVLSGAPGRELPIAAEVLPMLEAELEAAGRDAPSEAFLTMFAGFNEPFSGPDATGLEWLSRDPAEVRAYVDDPWCGQPLSNGFVHDMLLGARSMWTPENERRVSVGVPLLVFAGDQDPVGELGEGVRDLVGRYEKLGVGPITLRLYPQGRHEMLNETNRDEVHADLVAWLDAVVSARAAAFPGPGTGRSGGASTPR
jgi:alpha-beta hydrolase superfamily lysophospholipase